MINKHDLIHEIAKASVKQMSLESLEECAYQDIYADFDRMTTDELLKEARNSYPLILKNLEDKQ